MTNEAETTRLLGVNYEYRRIKSNMDQIFQSNKLISQAQPIKSIQLEPNLKPVLISEKTTADFESGPSMPAEQFEI